MAANGSVAVGYAGDKRIASDSVSGTNICGNIMAMKNPVTKSLNNSMSFALNELSNVLGGEGNVDLQSFNFSAVHAQLASHPYSA
ncbi:MAG: hypothetical protein CFH10_00555, partial [Alphaproteobacteria bacterium MarineAlpha4_Bin2]